MGLNHSEHQKSYEKDQEESTGAAFGVVAVGKMRSRPKRKDASDRKCA